MKARQLMNPAQFLMEIGQDSLTIFNGTTGLELPLDRLADGRLTDGCKSNLTLQLQRFIDRKSWQPRAQVFCAIGARGVSFRRLSLPASTKEELHRLLPLQIESEFPLPPDQLAWGFQLLTQPNHHFVASNAKRDLVVVAVKKDALEEYSSILTTCGALPVFTLAALVRSYLCPQPPATYSVLNIARNYSELITITAGVPTSVRILSWGRENIPASVQAPRGNGREESFALSPSHTQQASFGGTGSPSGQQPGSSPLDPLVRLFNGHALGQRVYVTGLPDLPSDFDFTSLLANGLGDGVDCQAVDIPLGSAGSLAIVGLQRALERDPHSPPLVLQLKQTNGKVQLEHRAPLKRAAIALALLVAALLLPYAEALLLKSHLARRLAAIKTDQGRLVTIDRELDFLQYLQENEPPYLDALLVLAKAAPAGTRLDSVSMNRHGDVSLRGSLRDGQQVAELRSKLIDSGFFASVSVDEQAPTPDRQKVNVRITAQWKPSSSRTPPQTEPGRGANQQKSATNPMPTGSPSPGDASAPPTKPPAPKPQN